MKRRIEHLRMDFYFSGRPWYHRAGVPVRSASGIPREVEDLSKLADGFKKAFAAIGAEVEFVKPGKYGLLKSCERNGCEIQFEPKRRTARFCPECRQSYDRRKEQPDYAKLNRDRARKGMRQLREGKYTTQPLSERLAALVARKQYEEKQRKLKKNVR